MKQITTYISIFIILINLNFLLSQNSKPSTFDIDVLIFDHLPSLNDNFEPPIAYGITYGIVKSKLNTTSRVPELNYLSPNEIPNYEGRIVTPELFPTFFTSTPSINIQIPFTLTFNLVPENGMYLFNYSSFFPIDDLGFDTNISNRIYKNELGEYHNFHFCLKMHQNFTYKGNEVFNFVGDDDAWVFINDELVMDVGGVHSPENGSADLSQLTQGESYTFDFYYCERRTNGSSIKIETNITFICPTYHDYCGKCGGDGSTCCDPTTTCNDNDKCTVDKCPNAVNSTAVNFPGACIHTPIKDTNTNTCLIGTCNPTTGKFEYKVKDTEVCLTPEESSEPSSSSILSISKSIMLITLILTYIF